MKGPQLCICLYFYLYLYFLICVSFVFVLSWRNVGVSGRLRGQQRRVHDSQERPRRRLRLLSLLLFLILPCFSFCHNLGLRPADKPRGTEVTNVYFRFIFALFPENHIFRLKISGKQDSESLRLLSQIFSIDLHWALVAGHYIHHHQASLFIIIIMMMMTTMIMIRVMMMIDDNDDDVTNVGRCWEDSLPSSCCLLIAGCRRHTTHSICISNGFCICMCNL